MAKVIIFHYDSSLRVKLAETLRSIGYVAYAAPDVLNAWEAVTALHPDVVVTDFPAYLKCANASYRTLSEAIRADPGMQDVAIVNLSSTVSAHLEKFSQSVGINATIPANSPVPDIVAAITSIVPATHLEQQ